MDHTVLLDRHTGKGQNGWKSILVSPIFGEEPKTAFKRGFLCCFQHLLLLFVWNEPKLNTLWSTNFLWKLKSGKEVFCRMWFSFTHGRTHLTAISLEVIGGSYCFFLLDRRPSKESLIFCGCGQTWTGMKKLGKIPGWISVHKFYWKWS